MKKKKSKRKVLWSIPTLGDDGRKIIGMKVVAVCYHSWKSVPLQYNGTTSICEKCGAEE